MQIFQKFLVLDPKKMEVIYHNFKYDNYHFFIVVLPLSLKEI